MSEVLVQGTLQNPLGAPVPNGIFRFTALRIADQVIPSTEAVYTSLEDGSYSFHIKHGVYRMEVLITNEYYLVADVFIDEATPNPIDIAGLAQYSPVVAPPVVIPGDPDWENLYNALRTNNLTTQRDLGEQLRNGDLFTATNKALIENATLQAAIAEETQSIANGSAKLTAIRNVFNDHAQQEASIDSVSLATRTGTAKRSQEVYESSTGVNEYYDVREYSDTESYLEDSSHYDGTSITTKRRRLAKGNGVVVTETFSADKYQQQYQGEYDDTDTSVRLIENYLASNGQLTKEHKTDFTYKNVNASVSDSQALTTDSVGNLTAVQRKGVSVGNRAVFDEIEVTQTGSTHTIQSDLTKYQGTDGVSLAEFDAVNNTLTVRGRLVVTNPDDFKGPAGESKYQELQYSTDNQNWHDEFAIADKWRRQRDVVNGVPGAWSDGYLLQAVDGAHGDTIYIEYNYAPDRSGPWSTTMQDNSIWRIERTVTNDTPGVWSDPARIKGNNGSQGWITDLKYQYAVRATDPDNMWHTNFSTGDHWRREKAVVYYTKEAFDAGTPDVDPNFWTNVTQIVPIKGIDYGAKQTTVFIYQRSTSQPAAPTGDLVYNFDDLTLTPGANLNGWSLTIPTGEDDIWVGLAVASTQGSSDTIAPAEWNITKWSVAGRVLAVSNLFCISATEPAVQFTKAVQNLETGVTTIQGTNTQGWQGTPPENLAQGAKLWYITNAKLVQGTTAEHTAAEYSSPVVFMINGVKGEPGLNGQGSFTFTGAAGTAKPTSATIEANVTAAAGRPAKDGDTASYYFGSASDTNATQYDFLRQSGSWVEFVAVVNGNQIVHGTISAQQVKAATFTGDEFNAAFNIRAGSGNNVAVMSGSDTYRFWAGNASSASAPFKVHQNGAVSASNLSVTGGGINLGNGKFVVDNNGHTTISTDPSNTQSRLVMTGDRLEVYEGNSLRVRIGRL